MIKVALRASSKKALVMHYPFEGRSPQCSKNGQACKPVGRRTLESLLKPEAKSALIQQPYYFCDAADCDVVYISALADHLIMKDHLKVRVGIKESEDPIPLCYCFNYDRKAIVDDVKEKGKTDIPKIISVHVKAGECRCEETNPSGRCCLGTIHQVVKTAMNEIKNG